ncbi:hypothetical protein DFH08DRAFT_799119 [Mycena albidolilacea]|uniref:Uncharacterized protein n=1 Tax=Mycena albidolilacea TaxID=1033008 RepID=A0AAD7APX4_9AGAR|nr:hypothetical protein DFH08DRAFT_799119 [Mycena albidolilacea]
MARTSTSMQNPNKENSCPNAQDRLRPTVVMLQRPPASIGAKIGSHNGLTSSRRPTMRWREDVFQPASDEDIEHNGGNEGEDENEMSEKARGKRKASAQGGKAEKRAPIT